MLRYRIALGIAAIIIFSGMLFVHVTNVEIQARFEEQRQRLKQQKADGTLPDSLKDVDLRAGAHFGRFG